MRQMVELTWLTTDNFLILLFAIRDIELSREDLRGRDSFFLNSREFTFRIIADKLQVGGAPALTKF